MSILSVPMEKASVAQVKLAVNLLRRITGVVLGLMLSAVAMESTAVLRGTLVA